MLSHHVPKSKGMKYLMFSTMENGGASIMRRVDGVVAYIEDLRLTLTTGEKAGTEEPKEKKLRLSMSNGLVKKVNAIDALRAMKKTDPKDYFILADSNNAWRFAQKAETMGYIGLIPTEEDRVLEVDRAKAKDIVRKNYPMLKVMENHEFKKAADGIKFLQESENIYVLKSLGDSGETIVPKVNDAKIANQLLVDALEKDKGYEGNGFVLEQKILDAVELTPQAVFWNGNLVFTDLDIETKTLGCGETGPNKGCGTNLILKTNTNDKINQMAFPEYIHKLAKKRKGLFIIDCGILIDKKSGDAYFTEFCFQRFGWDAFPVEFSMSDGNYFDRVMAGKNPLKYPIGFGVRLFNLDKKPNMSIEAEGDGVYLYDAKKSTETRFSTVGYQQDLGVVVGVGNSVIEAITSCYEEVSEIGFKDLYYRVKDDALSESYPQAIISRLRFALEHKLIDNKRLAAEMESIWSGSAQDSKEEAAEAMLAFSKKVSEHYKDKEKQMQDEFSREKTAMEAKHSAALEDFRMKHDEEIGTIKAALKDALTE